MPTVSTELEHLDRNAVLAFDRSAHEVLGTRLEIWLESSGSWFVADTTGQRCEVMAATAPPQLASWPSGDTVYLDPIDDGTYELAFSLPSLRQVRVFAIGTITTTDGVRLRQLAVAAHRQCQTGVTIDQLELENCGLLYQVTNDFEELSFLRRMAELLEISDLTFDLTMMADTICPKLRPLCDAAAMIVVGAHTVEEHGISSIEVDSPLTWSGDRVVDETSCIRLVDQFRELCEERPVVRNHWQQHEQSERFPGVNSFVLVPIVNSEMVIGWLLALNRSECATIFDQDLPWEISYREFGSHEATLMSSSAALLATHARNVELFRERAELLVSMVRALVSAIEAKDEYTRGHSERVAIYGKRLAEELKMNEDFCERLYLTGLLHDIGKIGVRDAVLRKQGPLTDSEFEEIKAHVDKGWAILQDLAPLSYVLPGVLHHHEQHDGTGYPDNLAGKAIPLEGRILAVADSFDAMTSDRPYRPGMPVKQAETILREGAGTQWDAEIVDAFFRVMPDILSTKENYVPRTPAVRKR
jgi:response regulator RpfG family c-di-GMP phosphodiesterase